MQSVHFQSAQWSMSVSGIKSGSLTLNLSHVSGASLSDDWSSDQSFIDPVLKDIKRWCLRRTIRCEQMVSADLMELLCSFKPIPDWGAAPPPWGAAPPPPSEESTPPPSEELAPPPSGAASPPEEQLLLTRNCGWVLRLSALVLQELQVMWVFPVCHLSAGWQAPPLPHLSTVSHWLEA